jgi:phosphate uptake regulator
MLQAMLHQSVAAFAEGDIEGAEAALAAGQDVEIVYQQIHDQLLGIMERCPRSANQTLYLRRAAYHLNRATERVRAICRWVGYASTGIQQAASPD